jgi:hypothetical protein
MEGRSFYSLVDMVCPIDMNLLGAFRLLCFFFGGWGGGGGGGCCGCVGLVVEPSLSAFPVLQPAAVGPSAG